MRADRKLEDEVAAIGDLSREELAARWAKAYGCPPPKGIKRGLLERAAAWHLQAQRLGGLSPNVRKRAAIRRASVGRLPLELQRRGREAARLERDTVPLTQLRPGTRLMREWNGRMHVVDVTEDGFVFDGKPYRSLSAIARRITGAHWSGPRFFGL